MSTMDRDKKEIKKASPCQLPTRQVEKFCERPTQAISAETSVRDLLRGLTNNPIAVIIIQILDGAKSNQISEDCINAIYDLSPSAWDESLQLVINELKLFCHKNKVFKVLSQLLNEIEFRQDNISMAIQAIPVDGDENEHKCLSLRLERGLGMILSVTVLRGDFS